MVFEFGRLRVSFLQTEKSDVYATDRTQQLIVPIVRRFHASFPTERATSWLLLCHNKSSVENYKALCPIF